MSLTPLTLSASVNGRPIKIAATSSPGTLIHTAQSGTAGVDEVCAWATNISATDETITVEFGGTTSPDDHLLDTYTIPAQAEAIPICTGQRINNGLLVKVFASVANVIVVTGNVNRYS